MSVGVGVLRSDSPASPKVSRLLTWAVCLLMFSPLYLLLTFYLAVPCLLAVLVIGFACALGVTISELSALPFQAPMKISRAPM
jgi:hypothetical protein